MAIALRVTATDRFYIEDFTIIPGETCTLSILLDNETAYTAFQTDIYLPNGLTVEQEDDDFIFDLTGRKARDHNIASQLQPNGSIRIMSYSPRINAYSGNSGALVTFNVMASEGFTGPAMIQLNNTLFTTTAGTEIPLADETCTVTTPKVSDLPGDVNNDGNLSIIDATTLIDVLLGGGTSANNLLNADCNSDGKITISDLTALIDALLGGAPLPEKNYEVINVNGVSFKMMKVQGGTFTMGATPEQGTEEPWNDEWPTHEVTVSSFSIGQTEVTQELWQAVMGNNPSYFTGDPKRPVEMVSWDECQQFIATLNQLTGMTFRMPTEAEWEYAARGGNRSEGYKYAGSNDINETAWWDDNAGDGVGESSPDYGTHPVALKKANELGLYDMSGNVWEWCQDWYGTYSQEVQINPTGPETGTEHLYRGGSWLNYARNCRVSCRFHWVTNGVNYVGLRLVK